MTANGGIDDEDDTTSELFSVTLKPWDGRVVRQAMKRMQDQFGDRTERAQLMRIVEMALLEAARRSRE